MLQYGIDAVYYIIADILDLAQKNNSALCQTVKAAIAYERKFYS